MSERIVFELEGPVTCTVAVPCEHSYAKPFRNIDPGSIRIYGMFQDAPGLWLYYLAAALLLDRKATP